MLTSRSRHYYFLKSFENLDNVYTIFNAMPERMHFFLRRTSFNLMYIVITFETNFLIKVETSRLTLSLTVTLFFSYHQLSSVNLVKQRNKL